MTSNLVTPDGEMFYEVSLNDAKRWISNWKNYMQQTITVAYLIRGFEMVNLLVDPPPICNKAYGVRIYYAMGDHQEPKTLLVAVEKSPDGTFVDILTKAMLTPKLPTSDIYDFSSPCPPTCDLDSPLYKA